jgi:site-specific recombinase XerD
VLGSWRPGRESTDDCARAHQQPALAGRLWRGEQFTSQGIAYIIREAGTRAKLGHVWPHMLRHSCSYHVANLSQVPDLRLI